MTKELSSKYNPTEVEAGRYQKWLDADVFKPSGDKKARKKITSMAQLPRTLRARARRARAEIREA